jgi:hypothetical protein
MGKFIDLTGQIFGRLTVIERNLETDSKRTPWKCRCECGKETIVLGDNLRRGRQVSCGCYHAEKQLKHGATVGGVKSSEYKVWQEMMRRCNNKKSQYYKYYGGRGVIVCERWLNGFENFIEDMGKRPSPKHSIDRINANGNYEPNNCRWATGSQQAVNQRIRNTNKSGHKGVSWDKRKQSWLATITVNYKRIHLGNFKDIKDAIEERKQAETKYHTYQPS